MDNYGHAPAGSSHWGGKDGMIFDVRIQKGVTSIGDCAFGAYHIHHCNNLKNVTISDSVASIGEYAFGCCDNLTSVMIPDSVTKIENGAFKECPCLKSVSVPANAYIAANAFPETTEVIRRK